MKLTVIGAGGCVGSAAAFHIATLRLVDEVVLLGRRQNVIEQHAMDLSTAVAPLNISVRAGTYAHIDGSDLVINAAGIHQSVLGDRTAVFGQNVNLLREIALEIKARCPGAVVITATNPIDPLNYATWRASGLDRKQFVGYSINDTLRFREFVSRAKGVRVDRVGGTVIGEHGGTQVLLFSSVRIDGQPVTFSEEEKEAVRGEIPKFFKRNEELATGRTAGWTCAVGLAALTRAIVQETGEVFPVSAVLDGEYGRRGISMGVPVRLGRGGIEEILEWELAGDEQVGLERSVERLAPAIETVEKILA